MNKGKTFNPQPFTAHEIKSLLHWADDGTTAGAKRKAIFTILWQAGTRRSELCSLVYPRDVFPIEDGTMIIRIPYPKGCNRKGSKRAMPREIGLGQKATNTICVWLKLRGEHEGPLFPTSTGKHVLPGEINKMVQRVARLAKLGRPCSPHSFRHTFARTLYEQNVGLVEIMQAMGHRSLLTTQNYLIHTGCTKVTKVTRELDWE